MRKDRRGLPGSSAEQARAEAARSLTAPMVVPRCDAAPVPRDATFGETGQGSLEAWNYFLQVHVSQKIRFTNLSKRHCAVSLHARGHQVDRAQDICNLLWFPKPRLLKCWNQKGREPPQGPTSLSTRGSQRKGGVRAGKAGFQRHEAAQGLRCGHPRDTLTTARPTPCHQDSRPSTHICGCTCSWTSRLPSWPS